MKLWGLVGLGLALSAAGGNSDSGHDYRTKLSDDEKRDLIEYLKAL